MLPIQPRNFGSHVHPPVRPLHRETHSKRVNKDKRKAEIVSIYGLSKVLSLDYSLTSPNGEFCLFGVRIKEV